MSEKQVKQPMGDASDGQLPSKKSICAKIRSTFRLTEEGATPPNWRIIFLIVFAMIGSTYSLTYIFPFLPSMIRFFGYAEEDKGYYTGLIASAMFAGRIVGSYFWGWLSDKKGRKPILILNLFLIAVANFGFGFSTTLAQAMAWRFMDGTFNGMVGVGKTVLYETSDNTNQAVGISSLSLAWGIGIILGPLISGHLAEPADKYEALKDSTFLKKYPYFLAAFMASMAAILPAIVCICFLEETSNRKKTKEKEGDISNLEEKLEKIVNPVTEAELEEETSPMKSSKLVHSTSFGQHMTDLQYIDDHDAKKFGSSNLIYGLGCPSYSVGDLTGDIIHEQDLRKQIASQEKLNSDFNKEPLLIKNGLIENGHPPQDEEKAEVIVPENRSCCSRCKQLGCMQLLSEKDVCLVVCVYSIVSFSYVGLDEVITVWISTEPSMGGLGFSTEQIGNALGLSSLPLMCIQIFMFTFFERKFGSLRVFQGANLYLIVFATSVACLRFLHDKTSALWPCILTFFALQKLSAIMCFSATSLLINNSVHPEQAGSVNGLAMTLTAIGRTLAPTVGGSIYAWSISHGVKIGFPFDVNCVFIAFGLTFLTASILSAFVPKYLETQTKKKKVPTATLR